MKYLIGLDGGGTKMAALLTDLDGNIIRSAKFGPSNVHDMGLEAFGERLKEIPEVLGIDDVNDVAALFAGLAGSTGKRFEVNAMLEAIFPKARVHNGNDAENILWAGLGAGDGCGMISGTGSICYARVNGELNRIGGWGWMFDPAGSGYDLGRDAVFACMREHDGRDGHTVLSDLFVEKFGSSIIDNMGEVYAKGKTFVASFAPMVFEAYRRGDRKATEIMEKTAYALAEMIIRASKFYDGSFRAVLAGSILTKEPEMAELVKKMTPSQAVVTVLDKEPVEGAIEAAKWLLTVDKMPKILNL